MPPTPQIRIAYFLSRYPAISHTFFLKEILGLREIGFEIETASVNPPDRPTSQLPPIEAAEARNTYCLKQIGAWGALYPLLLFFFPHQRVIPRGLSAGESLGRWDLSLRIY